jgi:flagellar biogenesis protein FliO
MGKTLLLGVTTQNIQTLATIESPEAINSDIKVVNSESKVNAESKLYKNIVHTVNAVDKETPNGV